MLSGRTRMPLTVWFTACGLFAPATDGISALSLRRAVEIGSYQDAPGGPVAGGRLVNLSGPVFARRDGTCVKRRVMPAGPLAEMPPGRAVKP
jgi:hypothetical protein